MINHGPTFQFGFLPAILALPFREAWELLWDSTLPLPIPDVEGERLLASGPSMIMLMCECPMDPDLNSHGYPIDATMLQKGMFPVLCLTEPEHIP